MLSLDVDGTRLDFEHSLVSLSKWEGKWQKPFFAWRQEDTKTQDEMVSYFEEMLVYPEDAVEQIEKLSPQQQVELVEYINENRTATVIREVQQKPGPKENVTSELIYYWMIAFNIDWAAENWHLSRLMTLVKICGVKQSKPEKQDVKSMRDLNAQRRRQMGTKG